jgi:hypothetical protein
MFQNYEVAYTEEGEVCRIDAEYNQQGLVNLMSNVEEQIGQLDGALQFLDAENAPQMIRGKFDRTSFSLSNFDRCSCFIGTYVSLSTFFILKYRNLTSRIL